MQRETLRLYIAGHFALGEASITKVDLLKYVEGAMLAYDTLKRNEIKTKELSSEQRLLARRNSQANKVLEDRTPREV